MKLGNLKTDTVRPEWVPQFGEYPDMFVALFARVGPSMEFITYDVEGGQYPTDTNFRSRGDYSSRILVQTWS